MMKVSLAMLAAALVSSPVLAQSNLQADVQKKLSSGKYKNVQVAVNGTNVTLTGSVETYQLKLDADERAHHVKGVTGVDNEIVVTADKGMSDAQLTDKLGKKIAYDRVGWPDNAFNAFNLQVQNGVATLSGVAAVPWAKESVLSTARNMPGITDVVDNIEVAPTSPSDDAARIALYRKIYGYPSLNRYASDPVAPIRITVINGNAVLTGVVDSKMDKEVAGIQANTVPGVFSVKNDLVVAGQTGGSK